MSTNKYLVNHEEPVGTLNITMDAANKYAKNPIKANGGHDNAVWFERNRYPNASKIVITNIMQLAIITIKNGTGCKIKSAIIRQ